MRRLLRTVAVLVLSLVLCLPAFAWNFSGHWIVAAIAYDRLTPKVRARVDELIRNHPDYATFGFKDAPAGSASHARAAFIYAAAWPDLIKPDNRFYDDTRADAVPTPSLPRFQDMKKHTNWHYYDTPFSPDGTPLIQQQPPHLLSELPRIIGEIRPSSGAQGSGAQVSYDLPWLEHLVGDSHQPLHSTSRFLKSQPTGDAGGNSVFVEPGRTLHSLWDNAGAEQDVPYDKVLQLAHEFARAERVPTTLSLDPRVWIEESFRLVQSDVYTFGPEAGSREHPLALPAGYEERARQIARQRIALAGYRLAAILNRRLK